MRDWLTPSEACVLGQLMTAPRYGLELVGGSGGLLSSESVYVLLGRMARKGLVERQSTRPARRGETGPERVLYRATRVGLVALRCHLELERVRTEG